MSATETPGAVDDRVWRGETLEARAQARRRQLLDAGYRLMGSGGTTAVTMRAVCREAGLSPRYFYESFANTDELVIAVYDDGNAELIEVLGASLTAHAADLDGLVGAAITAASSFFLADEARLRILIREPMSSTVLSGRRAGGAQEVVGRLVGLAENVIPGATAVDRDRLAMAASALAGALTFLTLDWIDGRLDATREQLIDHATELARSEIAAALSR